MKTDFFLGRPAMYKNVLWQLIGSVAVIVLFLISPAYADIYLGYELRASCSWDNLRCPQEVTPIIMHKINHDPAGPTLNHDYYEEITNPTTLNLVRLVENAHVNKILPNLRKSFTAPEPMRTGFLKQGLQEIRYVIGRLVNHPKALAFSAPVTKLLGRPTLPITFYERALKLYPRRAFTWAQYGNFLVELGKVEQGIARLKIAIEINPKLAMSYGWLAWAYEKNGDLDLADEYREKAKEKGFKGKLPAAQSNE